MRLRRFRTFTNSIALANTVERGHENDFLPANYVVIQLIHDTDVLADGRQLQLLRLAIDDLHSLLSASNSAEAPLVLLGRILLGFLEAGESFDASLLGQQLIEQEYLHRCRSSIRFLWGCTFFDSMLGLWQQYVERLFHAPTDELKLLRDELLIGYSGSTPD